MCGRYRIDDELDDIEIREIIDEVNRRVTSMDVKTRGDILPSDIAPVVAPGRDGAPSVFAMRWGFTLPDGRRIINARSETAASKPMFADGMRHRRCAIPASCYYEWERTASGRRKYEIRPEGRSSFFMAGVYRMEQTGPVFSILTRAPADSIAFIHNRMPLILPAGRVGDWTDPGADADNILRQAELAMAYRPSDDAIQLSMGF